MNELIEEIETLKAIIAGLQQQLLRVGNQEGVLKAAYLEGQMAKKQPALLTAKKPWVGLTDEDKAEILSRKWWNFEDEFDLVGFLGLLETKLKEKNA